MSSSVSCFQITGSALLTDYNSISVAQIADPPLRSQTELETYFKGLRSITANGFIPFQCPGSSDSDKVRYFSSVYMVSLIAAQASNCSNSRPPAHLCKSVVMSAIQTLNDFTTVNQCPISNIKAIKTRFESYLATIDSKSDSEPCLSGISLDQQQCGIVYIIIHNLGFAKRESAISFCTSTDSQDSCCSAFDLQKSSFSFNTPLVIGLSVVGGILLLLLLAFVIWKYVFNNRSYSPKTSREGQTTFKAVQTYKPKLIDEIQLNMGDIVIVKANFDDGWAFGLNITTESEGSFPLNCLSDLNVSDDGKLEEGRIVSIRNSSLTKKSQKDDDEDLLFKTVKISPALNSPDEKIAVNSLDDVTAQNGNIYTNHSSEVDKAEDDQNQFQTNMDDIYNTVKVSSNETDNSKNRQKNLFNSVKYSSNNSSDEKHDSIYNTVKVSPTSPHSSQSRNKSSSTFFSPSSPVDFLSTSPISPNKYDSVKIQSGLLKQKKSPRKFGNDELRYGTAKTSPSKSERPTVTATFNHLK